MPDIVEQTLQDFSPTGVLSRARGFEYRPEQQELAVAVAKALQQDSPLLAEAGTGVGKSLAYLLPALRFAVTCGRKAVVSTHTINLQEQLFSKDIPTASKALRIPFRAALLKGRSHYLCFTRLQRAINQAHDLFNREELAQLQRIRDWAENCGDGRLSALPSELGVSDKVRAQVCSESRVCTLRNCGPDCPYQAARRKAEEAELVVLNHTLFFSLMGLAEAARASSSDEDADNEQSPPAGFIFGNDFVILDEAHTIENVAAHQFGVQLSELELRRDLRRFYNPRTRKGSLRHAATPHLLCLIENAQAASDQFFTEAARDCGITRIPNDVHELRLRRPDWTRDTLSPALGALGKEILEMARTEENNVTRAEFKDAATRLQAYINAVQDIVSLGHRDSEVYWAELNGDRESHRFMTLRSAVINVAPLLREKLFESGRSCICTSATLSAGDLGESYFAGRVGAENAEMLRIGSPFDFSRQMHVHLLRSMPDPSNKEDYLPALVHHIIRALRQSRGHAFVLFTGYAALRTVADQLREVCAAEGWNLLVQGEGMNRTDMLRNFRATMGSVLLGTDSFWMGVDVPGEALSQVIVTKLPFDSPGSPIVEARSEDLLARGFNPFMQYSLPEAILKFRQGVGRLIRSKTDTGRITVLDSRMCTKHYGRHFIAALPPGTPLTIS